jgi:hypothetical protein
MRHRAIAGALAGASTLSPLPRQMRARAGGQSAAALRAAGDYPDPSGQSPLQL